MKGERQLREEAFRERAARVGVLLSCFCTFPIVSHETSSGHDERCPSHHMHAFYLTARAST